MLLYFQFIESSIKRALLGLLVKTIGVKFKFLKDLGKERKSLTINLDKGVVVSE